MGTLPRLAAFLLLVGVGGAAAGPADPPGVPAGWSAGGNPGQYEMGLDHATRRSGSASAFLRGLVPTPDGFGTLMQAIDAADYRGRRVRLSGFSKAAGVTGWAGLWMRVDGPSGVLTSDNMQSRPIKGTADWRRCEIVLNVPGAARMIAFGLLLSGGGQVWFDDLQLEAVDEEVPLTAAASPR